MRLLKGATDGIVIEINNIEKDIFDLKSKLKNKSFFPKNTDFYLREKDKKYYKDLFEIIDLEEHNLFLLKEKKISTEIKIKEEKKENIKLIKKTIRSGQKIDFDGTLIIVGDVNPGAEIIASGDVYILGRARGVVHAGSKGDKTKTIMSLSMEVSQIRIANAYATNSGEAPEGSEIAFFDIDTGELVVEEYKTK